MKKFNITFVLILTGMLVMASSQAAHCPSIHTIHLDKSGYYVAPGGWRPIPVIGMTCRDRKKNVPENCLFS